VSGGLELRIAPDVLADRVAALASEIEVAYAGTRPVLVTVLNGGVIVLADLVRRLRLPLTIDFLALSTYDGGRARIVKDLDADIAGKHVLLVEDIVDTGLTLAYLLQVLAARAPASLRIATLLDRRVRRIADVPLDFVGFEVGDEFLAGYGLDLDGLLREVPAVLAVTDADLARQDPRGAVAAALATDRTPSSWSAGRDGLG